jgi:hypothetical protein
VSSADNIILEALCYAREDDECPGCHCGTLEFSETEVTCRGECGMTVQLSAIEEWHDEKVKGP